MASNPLKVVDISEINGHAASEMLEAAKTQGFLFLKGHSFTELEIETIFDLSKTFFSLPYAYKSRHAIDYSNHGYTGYGVENLDPGKLQVGDPKEAMNIGSINFITGKSNKPLPDWFEKDPERCQIIESFMKKLYATSLRLLKLLAISLEIEDEEGVKGCDWFESRYNPTSSSGSILRLLHYPSVNINDPDLKVRAGAHTDYGSMTLLFQQPEQEGLEIYSTESKSWKAVPYCPSESDKEGAPIIMNIGDLLSYWTAGLLKSTIHRVKIPDSCQEKDRYSVVFFSHPNDETTLCPVPSPHIRAIKGRGANASDDLLTAKEHLARRLAASYGWSSREKSG